MSYEDIVLTFRVSGSECSGGHLSGSFIDDGSETDSRDHSIASNEFHQLAWTEMIDCLEEFQKAIRKLVRELRKAGTERRLHREELRIQEPGK